MATSGDKRGAGPERAYAPELPAAGEVVLDAEESAHLVRVRRVEAGAEVALFDGRGATRRARLLTADPRAARLVVLGEGADRAPRRALIVAASIPEPARADELVEALAWHVYRRVERLPRVEMVSRTVPRCFVAGRT